MEDVVAMEDVVLNSPRPTCWPSLTAIAQKFGIDAPYYVCSRRYIITKNLKKTKQYSQLMCTRRGRPCDDNEVDIPIFLKGATINVLIRTNAHKNQENEKCARLANRKPL